MSRDKFYFIHGEKLHSVGIMGSNEQYGRARNLGRWFAIVTERFSSEIARQIGPRDVYGQIVRNAIV